MARTRSVAENNTTKPTNPKDLIGILKPPLHLVPPSLRLYAALGFADGAIKYGPYNWRESHVRAEVYYSALNRHMDTWWDGEDIDPISHVPHLAHAASCIAILIDGTVGKTLIDNRPHKGAMAELIQLHTRKP